MGQRARRRSKSEDLKVSLEIHVVDDPELRRRQLMAIRNFLIAQQTANLERANSGASVGEPALTPESAGDEADGLDEFLGPLQAEVVRHLWRAKRPQPTSAVLEALNARRSRPIGYTTLQTTMARLASKKILHRYAAGRRHLYEVASPDAAGLAVRQVLNRYGQAAVSRFIEQARAHPDYRRILAPARRCVIPPR